MAAIFACSSIWLSDGLAAPQAVQQAPAISVQTMQAPSGAHYTIITAGDTAAASWTLKRPGLDDKTILLCIPAAFTTPYGGVQGFYALAGKLHNQDKPDPTIGGAVAIVGGECKIASAPQGQVDIKLIKEVLAKKGDLFQQFQVVVNGKGESFRDKSSFQRRGIATLKNGKTAIVESAESITLSQFATDAAALGVQQLAYTDMGPWDEGWYRLPNSGKVTVIGKDRSLTYRQSNWFTFRSNKQN
jgi:hypothetical protein